MSRRQIAFRQKKKMKRKGFTHRDIPIGMFRAEKKQMYSKWPIDTYSAHTQHTHSISFGLHFPNSALISPSNSRYELPDFIRKDVNRIINSRQLSELISKAYPFSVSSRNYARTIYNISTIAQKHFPHYHFALSLRLYRHFVAPLPPHTQKCVRT